MKFIREYCFAISFLFLLLVCWGCAAAPTPVSDKISDAGTNTDKKEKKERISIGQMPMVVVLMDDKTSDNTNWPTKDQYWTFFNEGKYNVVDYFKSLSYERFKIDVDGIYGPFSYEKPKAGLNSRLKESFRAFVSRIGPDKIKRQYDDNQDGIITTDELLFVMIDNKRKYTGAVRDIKVEGLAKINVVRLGYHTNLANAAHEVSHLLGTYDIYGSDCNSNKSLMSCTIITNAKQALANIVYGIDPYHKEMLGWIEPRVVEISKRGHETRCFDLQTPQYLRESIHHNQMPIKVVNSEHSKREFFLIEYRNSDFNESDGSYDKNLFDEGVLIWSVRHKPDGSFYKVQFSKDLSGPSIWTIGSRNEKKLQLHDENTRIQLYFQDGTFANVSVDVMKFSESGKTALVCLDI